MAKPDDVILERSLKAYINITIGILKNIVWIFYSLGEVLRYNEYLDTKYKIIEERREVEEKIQLGEQMIYALKTSVMVSQNLVKNSL